MLGKGKLQMIVRYYYGLCFPYESINKNPTPAIFYEKYQRAKSLLERTKP